MRLYLSSLRLGDHPQRLAELAGERTRAAVVVNACDVLDDDARKARLIQEIEALATLGLTATELDLRDYFDGGQADRPLREVLSECGVLWVRGGNTFVLRRAMRASGLDALLPELLDRDALVYAGYSAGPAMLGPSLRGVDLVDDPAVVAPGYDREPLWDCLGVLPYAIAPHYRSDHPESAQVEDLVRFYIDNHVPFIALRDGQAIVVAGASQEILTS